MQEAVIHFVSHNVMRSYSAAISDARAASGIILGLQKWPTNIRISGRIHFKTILSHLCRFRCLQSVDMGALVFGIVLKWVRTVFMLREMIFTTNGWWY
ncbi:hypothetical protein CDAR_85401 [Caerostris darwini]|uniref:Uncharacterized protein n=1 Tax=Caerostris darwini TaxID=1538125 RepID=A0AAV4UH24_9ARAC|nr:hypothetical protein CDAR_85401 [Caerostris darwini]